MKHQEANRRLKNIEGHIHGIQRMIQEDMYCIDIIRQIQAVQAALKKVNMIILDEHLNTCLVSAVRGDDPDERERVLHEITSVLATANKI